MDELKHQNQRLGAAMLDQISSLRDEVKSTVTLLRVDQVDQSKKAEDAKRGEKAKAADQVNTAVVDIPARVRRIVESAKPVTNIAISLAVLDSLTFEQMEYRHSQIHNAHPRTFAEVFKNKIIPWLHSSDSIFWISGKPGSGKSTLMKYIVDNPNTRIELRRWFGGLDPIIASHYFWINGTELQRSQNGLLRSLLYEILRQSPNLIDVALPDALKSITTMICNSRSPQYIWRRDEILSAYRRLAESGITGTRLCIFIDGLDEYKGDHDEIIDTIRHLKAMGIKMCVASRPWNVFEEAFGADRDCKLYLQDLNQPDIELYVNDKLRTRRDFQNLRVHTADAEEIVKEIVEKSQGVFLWVFLVVRSLVEGLRNQDRLSQLRKRLRDFPADLEEFFSHIFRSIEPTYRPQTAHMFQVALHTKGTLSPLMYWYLDEQEDEPDMALTMPTLALTLDEFQNRVDQMKTRITGRCKGLMEIATNPHNRNDPRVDFLHRTVKDFLMTTATRRTFASWQNQDFDPDLVIFKASVAELKSIALMNLEDSPAAESTFLTVLDSAKELEMKYQQTPIPYLEEVERVAGYAKEFSAEHRSKGQPWWGLDRSFMESAISHDLTLFVRTRLATHTALELRVFLDLAHSLEMFRVIVSSGPPFEISPKLQRQLLMSDDFQSKGRDEILEEMKEICRCASFATHKSGQFDASLDLYLRNILAAAEVEELIQLNRCRQKEIKKHKKKGKETWFQRKFRLLTNL